MRGRGGGARGPGPWIRADLCRRPMGGGAQCAGGAARAAAGSGPRRRLRRLHHVGGGGGRHPAPERQAAGPDGRVRAAQQLPGDRHLQPADRGHGPRQIHQLRAPHEGAAPAGRRAPGRGRGPGEGRGPGQGLRGGARGLVRGSPGLKTNLPIFKLKESCVRRRYSDFEWLKNELERDSKIVVPPLPGKALKRQLPFRGDEGIFEESFIEERRQGLEQFINKIAGHPLAQNERCLHMFLQEETIDRNYVPGKVRQ
uniref:Sorting nexin 12 n=1 Tax=Anas platyrhynchos platyrhynchos TaxID=8840 RepID=U3J4G0_ANAPP